MYIKIKRQNKFLNGILRRFWFLLLHIKLKVRACFREILKKAVTSQRL